MAGEINRYNYNAYEDHNSSMSWIFYDEIEP